LAELIVSITEIKSPSQTKKKKKQQQQRIMPITQSNIQNIATCIKYTES